MARTISILGCGWLGRPLGRQLAAAGVHVRGSTTSPEKRAALAADGIEPHRLALVPDLQADDPDAFFDADALVTAMPPPRRDDVEAFHPAQMDALAAALAGRPVRRVVFVSSTSVYPDRAGVVTEDEAGAPDRPSGRALLVAERRLLQAGGFETVVVRLGGLYGYDRRPGRWLAGRTDVARPEAPVNLIHRDDAVAVVHRLLDADGVGGEVFNAVADAHPTRRAFYTAAAAAEGLAPPSFADDDASGKSVSADKLKRRLGYVFRHPDPCADVP